MLYQKIHIRKYIFEIASSKYKFSKFVLQIMHFQNCFLKKIFFSKLLPQKNTFSKLYQKTAKSYQS